eukprot:1018020-Rhodomonas_salina.2
MSLAICAPLMPPWSSTLSTASNRSPASIRPDTAAGPPSLTRFTAIPFFPSGFRSVRPSPHLPPFPRAFPARPLPRPAAPAPAPAPTAPGRRTGAGAGSAVNASMSSSSSST